MKLRKETTKIKTYTRRERLQKLSFSCKQVHGVGKDVFICKYEDCKYQIKPCISIACPQKKTPCTQAGEECAYGKECKDHNHCNVLCMESHCDLIPDCKKTRHEKVLAIEPRECTTC